MTDATTFYRTVISNTQQFITAYENLRLIQDRIASDTALSSAAAAAAAQGGRADLAAADFDNLKLAMDQLETFMNTVNGSVPTGGVLKLAYYKVI
jgi:hypothetical protein